MTLRWLASALIVLLAAVGTPLVLSSFGLGPGGHVARLPIDPLLPAGAAVPGCGAAEKLVDLAVPDPVERQFGPGPLPPILSFGSPISRNQALSLGMVFPRLPNDEQAVLILRRDLDWDGDGDAEWTITALYGNRPPTPGETEPNYLDADGWFFEAHATTGHTAEQTLSELASNGRHPLPPMANVGQYPAVVIHADPIIRNDLRPWHVYWSDGIGDYSIRATRGPDFVVAVARSLYCADQPFPIKP